MFGDLTDNESALAQLMTWRQTITRTINVDQSVRRNNAAVCHSEIKARSYTMSSDTYFQCEQSRQIAIIFIIEMKKVSCKKGQL